MDNWKIFGGGEECKIHRIRLWLL